MHSVAMQSKLGGLQAWQNQPTKACSVMEIACSLHSKGMWSSLRVWASVQGVCSDDQFHLKNHAAGIHKCSPANLCVVAHPSPLIPQLSHHVIFFPFFLPSSSIVASICANPLALRMLNLENMMTKLPQQIVLKRKVKRKWTEWLCHAIDSKFNKIPN